MKRRGFLKILGGLLSLPVAAKLMKGKSFLKPAAKTVAKTLPFISLAATGSESKPPTIFKNPLRFIF